MLSASNAKWELRFLYNITRVLLAADIDKSIINVKIKVTTIPIGAKLRNFLGASLPALRDV